MSTQTDAVQELRCGRRTILAQIGLAASVVAMSAVNPEYAVAQPEGKGPDEKKTAGQPVQLNLPDEIVEFTVKIVWVEERKKPDGERPKGPASPVQKPAADDVKKGEEKKGEEKKDEEKKDPRAKPKVKPGDPVVGAKVYDHLPNVFLGKTDKNGELVLKIKNGTVVRLVEPEYGEQQALRVVQGELTPGSDVRKGRAGEGWTVRG
jgi:hypothetical protein